VVVNVKGVDTALDSLNISAIRTADPFSPQLKSFQGSGKDRIFAHREGRIAQIQTHSDPEPNGTMARSCVENFFFDKSKSGKGILPQQCFCRMQWQRQRHCSGSLRQLYLLQTLSCLILQ
jgi:hypothetical protein